MKTLASFIDHTRLSADTTPAQVLQLCTEAQRFGFAAVCVNSTYVALAAQELKNSAIAVASVVGFPLGASTMRVKVFEAEEALHAGARELDVVSPIGWMKSGHWDLVREEWQALRRISQGRVLKVILECALLSREEKIRACQIASEVVVDFVKTSTGFGPSGATVEDVELLKAHVTGLVQVKASAGIRSKAFAEELIAAGASRLGTSAAVEFLTPATDLF